VFALKNPPTSRGRDKHVIAILVTPDADAFEVLAAQQIFGPHLLPLLAAATGERDSPYSLVLCGEARRHVLPNGVDLGELAPLEAMLDADTVIVPGVQNPLAVRSEGLLDSLRRAAAAGARMVSFCGGAFILGYARLLDHRRATTHWLLAREFRAAFPLVRLDVDRLYVNDGSVHTAGGVLSATDLALHIVAMDRGQSYANDLARMLISAHHRPGGQAQLEKRSLRSLEEQTMDCFLQWLRDHIAEPLTLAQLATHQHVSERTLARRFHQTVGMTASDWIARERISHARVLLESTNYRIGEVATMVGFRSPETFRRNFEKLVGTSASSYRRAFHNTRLGAQPEA
jgi:AraC family transcriptional activator FtrA